MTISRKFAAKIKRTAGQSVDADVTIELTYDEEYDPYAVQMILSVENQQDVVWTFSRELLASGVNAITPVGGGDVKFRWPSGTSRTLLLLCLKNPSGHADLALPRQEVIDFLGETTALVLIGEENVGELLDEALEEILNS